MKSDFGNNIYSIKNEIPSTCLEKLKQELLNDLNDYLFNLIFNTSTLIHTLKQLATRNVLIEIVYPKNNKKYALNVLWWLPSHKKQLKGR